MGNSRQVVGTFFNGMNMFLLDSFIGEVPNPIGCAG